MNNVTFLNPHHDRQLFMTFVILWNRMMGLTTPEVHTRIIKWLQNGVDMNDDRLLLMAFRACGKSSLVGLYCAWTLMRNPDTRILVVATDEHLSHRMVRNVRRIIERHPMVKHLVPKNADQWAEHRFTVKRRGELRDPSMMGVGITGNFTGMRADLIICDDVEVPNTANTTDKRDDLRLRLAELDYVAADGARILYIGTPHTFDTIYATRRRNDVPGHAPFLSAYKKLTIPVMDARGKPAWPEKYGVHKIADLRARSGEAIFQSQMMLIPVNITTSRLDPSAIDVYDHDLEPVREIGELFIGEHKIVSAHAWWDPAFGSAKGDGSVVACVFTDTRGHLYVHNVTYIRTAANHEDDEATQQCTQVAAILKNNFMPVISVETNGLGRLLPGLLRREIVKTRAGAAIIEHAETTSKNDRILRAFETPMAARMLHIHRSVLNTKLLDELRDFDPGRTTNRDDGLDAVAGAILSEPLRLHPIGPGGAGRPFWKH